MCQGVTPPFSGRFYINSAFWIHGILDLIFAFLLTVYPPIVIVLKAIPDDPLSYVWIYVAAGALYVVGISSFYISLRPSHGEIVLLLKAKMFWSGSVVLGHIITFILLGDKGREIPWVLWMTFSIFSLGFLVWGSYWWMQCVMGGRNEDL